MLAKALAVAECARAFRPEESPSVPGLFRLGVPNRELPHVLRDLHVALEALDRAAAASDEPEAVLGVVVRYVVDRGVDPVALDRHLARVASARVAATDVDLEGVADLVPLPGEVGPADRHADETVDAANARARIGRPDLGPSAPEAPPPRFEYPVGDTVELGGDDARSLGRAAAVISKPAPGHGAPPPKPREGARESVDKRGMSRALSKELDILGARLNRIVAKAGASPKVKGLMSQFAALTEGMMSDTGVGGEPRFEVNEAVVAAIMRVANEVADFEAEIGELAEFESVPGM